MKEYKEKNKSLIVSITLLLILGVGVTFAYLGAYISGGLDVDVTVSSDKLDDLKFAVDKPMSLTVSTTSLTQGGENLNDTAVATVSLKANSTNNSASYLYYVYFKINSNDYEYTTSTHKPEILLKVTDPNGNPVTSAPGLTYDEDLEGFDITETGPGAYLVSGDARIRSDSSTTYTNQTWNFEMIFRNLNTNQASNQGKELHAEVIAQKKELLPTLAEYVIDKYTADGVDGMYKFDGSIDYLTGVDEPNDGSIRFSGYDYKLTQKAIDAGFTAVYNDLIKFTCNGTTRIIGYNCTNNPVLKIANNNSLTSTTLKGILDKALSEGYIEANIKNYVCFGSTATVCPEDNLYRILTVSSEENTTTGVLEDRVKLVKYDYASSSLYSAGGESPSYSSVSSTEYSYLGSSTTYYYYYWNSVGANGAKTATGYYNIWRYSKLNSINLNKTYLTNINTYWSNMIAENYWYTGGSYGVPTGLEFYSYEHGDNRVMESPFGMDKAKVGLMYISDYYLASDIKYWTSNFNLYNNVPLLDFGNWLYLSSSTKEWTISRYHHFTDPNQVGSVYYIRTDSGILTSEYTIRGVNYESAAIRPAFYLKTDVLYKSGTGTKTDPIRIKY